VGALVGDDGMTWTKIGDDSTDSPKVLRVSRSARLLNIEGLVWCNRHLTNGALPPGALGRITDSPDPRADADELVDAGIWTKTESGWQLDWTDQETAKEVEARRDEWRTRTERQRRHVRGDHDLCDPKRCWYLRDHPEAVTRDTHSDSRKDSRSESPLPTPLRSRREEGERRGHETDAAQARAGSCHWQDDGSGITCQHCGLAKTNRIHQTGTP
jgi:hypothetical protein